MKLILFRNILIGLVFFFFFKLVIPPLCDEYMGYFDSRCCFLCFLYYISFSHVLHIFSRLLVFKFLVLLFMPLFSWCCYSCLCLFFSFNLNVNFQLTGGGSNIYDYRAVKRWTTERKLGYFLVDCDKVK